MFGTRYSGSGATTGMQICAQVALSPGIINTFLPLFCGGYLFPFDLHCHGLQQLTPWLIAQKISLRFVLQLRCCEPGLRRYPTTFGCRRCVLSGRPASRLYAQDVIRASRHLEGDWRIGYQYSSTECGIIAAQVFTSSWLPDTNIVAVGRPVDGLEVCIQDETGALVAAGEIGEIVIRCRFLAQGYWNNLELTAKVFQTDPLDSAIRIYRTGDLGRWRSDGTLEYVGRKGRRIRLRGYNVEPFQVECELMRQPGVKDAVVVLHDGAAGQEPCLVGYVSAPANASPPAMRGWLAERLPSYMVPSYIVVLDRFPVASSGKIDLNALPPPYREETRLVAFRAPSDDREHELLQFGKRF